MLKIYRIKYISDLNLLNENNRFKWNENNLNQIKLLFTDSLKHFLGNSIISIVNMI